MPFCGGALFVVKSLERKSGCFHLVRVIVFAIVSRFNLLLISSAFAAVPGRITPRCLICIGSRRLGGLSGGLAGFLPFIVVLLDEGLEHDSGNLLFNDILQSLIVEFGQLLHNLGTTLRSLHLLANCRAAQITLP